MAKVPEFFNFFLRHLSVLTAELFVINAEAVLAKFFAERRGVNGKLLREGKEVMWIESDLIGDSACIVWGKFRQPRENTPKKISERRDGRTCHRNFSPLRVFQTGHKMLAGQYLAPGIPNGRSPVSLWAFLLFPFDIKRLFFQISYSLTKKPSKCKRFVEIFVDLPHMIGRWTQAEISKAIPHNPARADGEKIQVRKKALFRRNTFCISRKSNEFAA